MLQGIKSVLVGVTEEGKDEPSSALAYGLSLALQAEAHVTVHAAALKIVLHHAFVSSYAAGLAKAENRRIHALADAVSERTRSEADATGVVSTVEHPQLAFSDLRAAFLAQARVNDVCILDAEPSAIDIDRGLIEAVLFESGRPLLIVPPGRVAFAARRILVAWDGSLPSARALGDALPLLRAADAVELVSVVGEKDLSQLVPGADAAPYLARHGVNVTVTALTAENGDVAETLRQSASETAADLIVMGAYKHSRLREWVLGGVTQSLLKASPVPLFMSH
jgi:nucleotide-binding universal stress UspA family protein